MRIRAERYYFFCSKFKTRKSNYPFLLSIQKQIQFEMIKKKLLNETSFEEILKIFLKWVLYFDWILSLSMKNLSLVKTLASLALPGSVGLSTK